MPTSDHADDDRSAKPLWWRRRSPTGLLAVATAAAAVGALVAAVAIARTGPDPTDSAPPQETTTPARPRAGPATSPSLPPSRSSDDKRETAATDSGDSPVGGAGPSRSSATTTTTLPGVVDQHDPTAVVRAVIELAAAGVFPKDAAPYLAGGDEQVATELFMFTAEGIAGHEVGECTASGVGAERRARCTAAIETSYGAQTSVEFTLDRARDTDPWYISTIQMTGGGLIGRASTLEVGH